MIYVDSCHRWNIDEIDQLPDSMKIVFRFIYDTCDDYESLANRKGKSFAVPYAKESVRGHLQCINSSKYYHLLSLINYKFVIYACANEGDTNL